MRRGTNFQALGGFNQTVVLDTIRRTREGVSRVEIAKQTGLSAQTVSNMSRRLLNDGIINEAGQQILGVGKPRTILQLNPSGRYAIGVHIDPAVITYVILDLDGQIVARASTSTPSSMPPDRVIESMTNSIESIIATSGAPRDRVLGIGIAAPGPVNLDRGIILEPPLLEHWHSVALRDALADATGFLVLLEKDVTAAAVAELWKSEGEERDNFMFFYYGTGTGVGLALGHEAVRGSTGNPGEAGHIIVDPDGPTCRCGRRGCLGDAIMPRILVETAIERGAIDAPGGTLDSGTVDACFTLLAERASAGDPGASRILDETAGHIAAAIVTIASLLDLDRVVFGGPYWERVSGYLLPKLPDLINSSDVLLTPHSVAVTSATIGGAVVAVGAACLVLDNVLSPRPSALLISASNPVNG